MVGARLLAMAAVAVFPYARLQTSGDLHQHPASAGAHRHPEAARLQNPVPADPASLAAGHAIFEKHCASCHGDTGKGDGLMAEELDPRPADLSDAERKHGSSDGEVFTVISHGVKGTGMRAFSRKLTAHEIWEVVNYVRSIGSKPGQEPESPGRPEPPSCNQAPL